MKTIVTHLGPDLDAITSIWLVKMFFPGWEEASLAFVPAGKTLNDLPPDGNGEILHVDTGLGTFDHHQTNADTCAAKLVYEEIKRRSGIDPALERIVSVVNEVDHFRESMFPNPTADYWDFSLASLVDGWRLLYPNDPLTYVASTMEALDALYKVFQNKVWAEQEIKEKGIEFMTKWGKALALQTTNDEVVHLGQKMGYVLVIRKDPNKGYLRLKAIPRDDIDLQSVYTILKDEEPEATWFLHASHHMVLNGSTKNPDMRPTKKSLNDVIEVVKRALYV